jgi:hypothetical protein
MTPKQKAEELVDKMQYPLHGVYVISHVANELALIAVDEILKLHKKLPLETLEYYVEVKNEIEKI